MPSGIPGSLHSQSRLQALPQHSILVHRSAFNAAIKLLVACQSLESTRKRAACSEVEERRFSAASKEHREERGFSPGDLHGKLCGNPPWPASGRAVAPAASALAKGKGMDGRPTHFGTQSYSRSAFRCLEKSPYCAAICRLVRKSTPDTNFVNRVFAVPNSPPGRFPQPSTKELQFL
jgi:hypothetical protein